MTREEAAERLGVYAQTVDRLRRRGQLPAIQLVLRGRVRFLDDDVERLQAPELRGRVPAREDELAWKYRAPHLERFSLLWHRQCPGLVQWESGRSKR